MSIHATDPFATPEEQRSPVRRLRGRLPAAVTLWTAPGPAGLTVSSTVVVDGEPGRLLGVLDEESDLWTAAQTAGVFAVVPLTPADHRLADRFAGLLPAPGGVFLGYEWTPTEFGPVLAGRGTWAGCRLDGARPFGWGLLVEATIERVEIGPGPAGQLIHYRGGYRDLPADRSTGA
jgi:3-hydroxy-9,10-secoandrosta-1,3,5(10)-triene-9,17-dione monooxygenase reductase component